MWITAENLVALNIMHNRYRALPSEKYVSEHAQNAHRIIPRMRKVSFEHLLSIDTFYCIQMILLADSEGPDQTARIWAFAIRACPEGIFFFCLARSI